MEKNVFGLDNNYPYSMEYEDKTPTLNAMRSRFELQEASKRATNTGGDVLVFDLPYNLQNTYLDNAENLSLQTDITLNSIFTESNTNFTLTFDKCGCHSIIESYRITCGGVNYSNLPNYAGLSCVMRELDMDNFSAGNEGMLLTGTTQNMCGVFLRYSQDGSGPINPQFTTLSVKLPLNFSFFANCRQNFPLFGFAPLRIEITLNAACRVGAYNFTGVAQHPITNSLISYTNTKLVGYNIELSQSAQNMVEQSNGGIYTINSYNWANYSQIIDSNLTTISSIIPTHVSSLVRILTTIRDSGKIATLNSNTIANGGSFANGHFINPVTEYYYDIDGQQFPEMGIKIKGQGAVAFKGLLLADDALNIQDSTSCILSYGEPSIDHIFDINAFTYSFGASGSPYDVDGDIGSFISGYNFESSNTHHSHSMNDGISTRGSIVQYNANCNALTRSVVVDHYCQYNVILTMNIKAGGIFILNE